MLHVPGTLRYQCLHQIIDLIEHLSSEQCSVKPLCELFEVPRSSYIYRIKQRNKIDSERESLKQKVSDIHEQSRQAAGSRTITGQLNHDGENIGRYKVSSLMREVGIKSKQPNKPKYKNTGGESKVAPNLLKRKFTIEKVNQVWCGDVTYIWAGDKWLYLGKMRLSPST